MFEENVRRIKRIGFMRRWCRFRTQTKHKRGHACIRSWRIRMPTEVTCFYTLTHTHAFRLSKSPWVIFTLDCNPSAALLWLHFIESALTHALHSPIMLLFSITCTQSAAVRLLYRKIWKKYLHLYNPVSPALTISTLWIGVWCPKSIILLMQYIWNHASVHSWKIWILNEGDLGWTTLLSAVSCICDLAKTKNMVLVW